MNLRLHRFLPYTRAEGPGLRACLWVQGCPIHCPGCAVPWTWNVAAGEERTVDSLAAEILALKDIEGVTFLGGEPFEQATALAVLASRLREADLSIMTFSGYTFEHLSASNREDWNSLLEVTDLLLDGPFRQDLLDTSRPWLGSSNQRYRFLTERYLYLSDTITNLPNRLESVLKESNGLNWRVDATSLRY